MSEEEIKRLKFSVNANTESTKIFFLDGDDKISEVIGIHEHSSDEPVATFADSKYVVLDSCEINDFALVTRLD